MNRIFIRISGLLLCGLLLASGPASAQQKLPKGNIKFAVVNFQKIFKVAFKPAPVSGWIANIMISIPRVIGGLLLSIDFGSSKFGMPWTDQEQGLALFEIASWFPEDVAQFGVPFSLAPWFFAWMGGASEAIGGLFLMLGFGTRIAAFFIMSTMLVAIFYQKWGEGTWGMLPAMGFLWISIYALVLGSGKLGIDHLIYRIRSKSF